MRTVTAASAFFIGLLIASSLAGCGAEPTTVIPAPATPTIEPSPTRPLSPPTPTFSPQGSNSQVDPIAIEMLRSAIDVKDRLQSYHIVTTQEGDEEGRIEEDFMAPDRWRTKIFSREVIRIGTSVYTREDGADTYVETEEESQVSPGPLFGIRSIIDIVERVAIIGEEELDGHEVTHIRYSYDPGKVPDLPSFGDGLITHDFWIEKDTSRIIKFATDAIGAPIYLVFSRFNEPVEPPIEKPDNVTQETMP